MYGDSNFRDDGNNIHSMGLDYYKFEPRVNNMADVNVGVAVNQPGSALDFNNFSPVESETNLSEPLIVDLLESANISSASAIIHARGRTLDRANSSVVSNNDNTLSRGFSIVKLFTELPEQHVVTRSGRVSKPARKDFIQY